MRGGGGGGGVVSGLLKRFDRGRAQALRGTSHDDGFWRFHRSLLWFVVCVLTENIALHHSASLVIAFPTGGANLLSVGLKWLDLPVPCARLRLPRGEIELCESSSSLQGPAHAPRPP